MCYTVIYSWFQGEEENIFDWPSQSPEFNLSLQIQSMKNFTTSRNWLQWRPGRASAQHTGKINLVVNTWNWICWKYWCNPVRTENKRCQEIKEYTPHHSVLQNQPTDQCDPKQDWTFRAEPEKLPEKSQRHHDTGSRFNNKTFVDCVVWVCGGSSVPSFGQRTKQPNHFSGWRSEILLAGWVSHLISLWLSCCWWKPD